MRRGVETHLEDGEGSIKGCRSQRMEEGRKTRY